MKNSLTRLLFVFHTAFKKTTITQIAKHLKAQFVLPTSGTQKAMPHPLGSSRSHPAPQELISRPTCLPGWWTSRMGTRPCGGVGVSLDPGTRTSLLIRFNCCRQKWVTNENAAPPFTVWQWEINASPAPISCDRWRCHGQTFPRGDSDSSAQVHHGASAPVSSPRPRLKRAHRDTACSSMTSTTATDVWRALLQAYTQQGKHTQWWNFDQRSWKIPFLSL